MNGGKRFAKALAKYVIGELIVTGIVAAGTNLLDGKDILGRKKRPVRETKVDWKGNVVLGSRDYQVV